MNYIILYFVIKYAGDWDKVYEALNKKEKVSLEDIHELEKKVKSEQWNVITILDIDYPTKLKQVFKPPFAIFYKGKKDLLESKLITLTGNQVSDSIKEWIEKYVPEVEKHNHIATGHFKGADEEIAKQSKEGRLIVCASGLDQSNYFPNEYDLMISEYPNGVQPKKEHFRNRNRIIAAFADSLILFSSEKNGGINHLISCFLNLGKDVYCFPGDGGAMDGNSELIKQGATLITSIMDISN